MQTGKIFKRQVSVPKQMEHVHGSTEEASAHRPDWSRSGREARPIIWRRSVTG